MAPGRAVATAVAAVIGSDDQIVAELAELVLPKHQVAVAETDYGDGADRLDW